MLGSQDHNVVLAGRGWFDVRGKETRIMLQVMMGGGGGLWVAEIFITSDSSGRDGVCSTLQESAIIARFPRIGCYFKSVDHLLMSCIVHSFIYLYIEKLKKTEN